MQGVGNDFVLIDGREWEDFDWPALAIAMCERHTGVGADGLLILANSARADIRMRMFNPDGSEDVCGNGLRCVARYIVEHGIVKKDELNVEILAGVRSARVLRNEEGAIEAVTVGMGLPLFDPADVPMLADALAVQDFPLPLPGGRELAITALSTGSTHSVAFVPELPSESEFFETSPLVENHPLFPQRTSLMWCLPEPNGTLRLRIWERGAGETFGCGTGACAVGVAAVLKGIAGAGEPVKIVSKGGTLIIQWQPGEEIKMTGPAEEVFEGTYPFSSGN